MLRTPASRVAAPAILLAAIIVSFVSADQTIPATDPLVVRLGRVFTSNTSFDAVGMSWLGGGLRVTHTGSILRAQFAATSHAYRVSFYQTTEGYMPYEGTSWVPGSGANESIVISSMTSGTVDVILNIPADYFGNGAAILSFTTNGEFTSTPTPPRILHALGDSITAATNVHGGYPSCHDGGLQADYSASWMGLLRSFFDASCSTVAVGGHGLVRNCCGQTDGLMPDFYQRTNRADSTPTFPFKDTPPAGLLVYLGTNDYSGGESPALDALFTAGYVEFMNNVTKKWYGTEAAPANVTFFAVLGPMSPFLPANATLLAVKEATAQGLNVVFVNATLACNDQLTKCEDGCAGHPGVGSHRNIARIVAPYVSKALGWPMVGSL